MMNPETILYVYEIEGNIRSDLHAPPSCFVGLWNEDDFSYLFFTEPQDGFVAACLSQSACTLRTRHDTLYSEWQDAIPPDGIALGGVLFVPANHPSPPSGAVLLDPSVVFGDGAHPTTVACLNFINEIIATRGVRSMLDLGTGSGILAIAAAALGMERIAAVDKNVLAVQTAEKNVRLNGLGATISVIEGDARSFISEGYELAVANLPFEVLLDISMVDRIADVRHWVVSGVSEAQGKTLEGFFAQKGFQRNMIRHDHPWVTFVMSRALASSGEDAA